MVEHFMKKNNSYRYVENVIEKKVIVQYVSKFMKKKSDQYVKNFMKKSHTIVCRKCYEKKSYYSMSQIF